MTRNGETFLLLKPKEVLKKESVMTVLSRQPLTQLKPPLVKMSKFPFAHRVWNGKKTLASDGKAPSEFQTMWSIKKQDLEHKEMLSKMKILDSLVARQESLAEYEEALEKKLIYELLLISSSLSRSLSLYFLCSSCVIFFQFLCLVLFIFVL